MKISITAFPVMLFLLLAGIDGGNGVTSAFNCFPYVHPIIPLRQKHYHQYQRHYQHRHQSCNTILSSSSDPSSQTPQSPPNQSPKQHQPSKTTTTSNRPTCPRTQS